MKNTSLVHIEKDGKYLMMHRIKKQNDMNKDKWIGVGGKFEENESPEECAKREAEEETGLKINELTYRGIVTFVNTVYEGVYMHLFSCKSFSGAVKTCDEGVLEWIDKKKLYELPIWEGDKIFLRLLEEERPFFSLKLVYDDETLVSAALDGQELDITDALI